MGQRRRGQSIAARCRVAIAATASLLVAGACAPSVDPATLLRQAKSQVDAAHSFHFRLSSSNVAGSGPLLTGGDGNALRPASVSGTLQVSISGFVVSVQVVSVGGVFYVKLPTGGGFSSANPSDYGFADPAQLIDTSNGLSSLLLRCASPHVQDDDRQNGEALHEVGCTLPGQAVAALLTSADPSRGVAAVFGIDSGNSQLRRVVLTGRFFSTTADSTFTLVLDNYGENVTITPPPG